MHFATRKEALAIVVGLSKASKLPCPSYSLAASDCHTGSLLRKEVPTSICSKCYARRGNYMYPHMRAHFERRLQAIRHPDWVDAMVFLIKDEPLFRWHDSGDLQDMAHLMNIVEVARRTPTTRHWLPTREYKLVTEFAEHNEIPENLIIRLSAYNFEQRGPEALAKKLGVLVSGVSKLDYNCPAPDQGNKCLDCRKCWDKRVFSVVYHRH